MGSLAYGHLADKDLSILITLYTACGIHLDDIFARDVTIVQTFNERFMRNEKQLDPILDCFAGVLRDFQLYFDPPIYNIIITSTLNAVTALLLEEDMKGVVVSRFTSTLMFSYAWLKVQRSALGYPNFIRVMSGASEAYAFFIFRPWTSRPLLFQCLQQIMIFINNGK